MLRPTAIPELETDRLRLRGWRDEDTGPMTSINADPAVARWLGPTDPRLTESRIAAWIDHWRLHRFGLWAVEEKQTGQFIGRVGLVQHDDWKTSAHDAEVGWTLASQTWGRGYATEAARAALAWAPTRGLRTIISITLPNNVRSRRVMEKLDLRFQGRTHWHGFDQVWYKIELPPP